jgi:chromosomal replication initiation ATPase DnaA
MTAYESRPYIEAIQGVMSDRFHTRLEDLKAKQRTQHADFYQQVAMYLCHKITRRSFPRIRVGIGSQVRKCDS